MPDRDGSSKPLWIAVGAALAIVAVLWPLSARHSEINDRAASSAAYYSDHAKDQIAVKCGRLPGQPRSNCIEEEQQSARENERDIHDLRSQEIMALWTSVMGWMAVVGVVLTGVGVYFVWGTLKEAQTATNAAIDAANTTKDVGKKQLAPYLYIESGNYYIDNSRIYIQAFVGNAGNTPAKNTTIKFNLRIVWYKQRSALEATRTMFRYELEDQQGATIDFIENGRLREANGVIDKRELSREALERVDVDGSISVFCVMRWDDLFGDWYETETVIGEPLRPPENFTPDDAIRQGDLNTWKVRIPEDQLNKQDKK